MFQKAWGNKYLNVVTWLLFSLLIKFWLRACLSDVKYVSWFTSFFSSGLIRTPEQR